MSTDSVLREEVTTTADHETIRTWVEQRGSMPARVNELTGEDSGSLAIVPKGKDDDSLNLISWDEFFETFEDERLAFAYQTEKADPNAKWFCQFVTRDSERPDEALLDAESDDSWRLETTTETERQIHAHSTPEVGLEEGDTAETAITRRRIVEREIIETDHFRSRVVDSETTDETVLDSEILSMEIDRSEIIDRTTIETEVVTRAAVRTELEERYLVESELTEREIVERDVDEESSSRETNETSAEVDSTEADTIEQELIEGEVFDDPESRRSVVESEVVRRAIAESELQEGETIETEVIARRIVESEVVERLLVTTALAGGEVINHEHVESEVVDMQVIEERRERDHPDETASAALEAEPASNEDPATDTTTDAVGTADATAVEEGKDVFTAEGERIGRVAAVHDGLLYLDVDADHTETVASRLEWGDPDEAVPIELDRLTRVTEEAVYLGEFTAQP